MNAPVTDIRPDAEIIAMTPPTLTGDIAVFAKAFLAAQKAQEAVKKASTNPAFKSKYADLAGVVEAVVPALNDNGIAYMQLPSNDGELVGVTTILIHESGATCTGTLHMKPSKADPQGVGSAITYARRYALLAITGAAPEDDDGQAASTKATRPAAAPQQAPADDMNGTGPSPPGPDWWGAEGFGMSAHAAKQNGVDVRHEDLRSELGRLTTAADWKKWCADNSDEIRAMPKAWRVILRQEAEDIATELGVDRNGRK
jgi:hypothetical protein